MKEIFIKVSSLEDVDKRIIERANITTDLISIDDLISIIDNLQWENERLEDEIRELKEEKENRETFDYSEWKANQE